MRNLSRIVIASSILFLFSACGSEEPRTQSESGSSKLPLREKIQQEQEAAIPGGGKARKQESHSINDGGVRDIGEPCDFHSYVVNPGEKAQMVFTLWIGSEYPSGLRFKLTQNETEKYGFDFYVDYTEVLPLTHPIWLIDVRGYIDIPRSFDSYYHQGGYRIFWSKQDRGRIVLDSEGYVKTGYLSEEQIRNALRNVEFMNTFSSEVTGAHDADIPLILKQSRTESYFAAVTISVFAPARTDFHLSSSPPEVRFDGGSYGSFNLTVTRSSTSSPFLIHGPDDNPDCYE